MVLRTRLHRREIPSRSSRKARRLRADEGWFGGKVRSSQRGAKSEFEKGLKTVEDEFGPLGGVRRKSEAERMDIAVGRLEKKKEKAGVHPA
jgi:hypothetical protein